MRAFALVLALLGALHASSPNAAAIEKRSIDEFSATKARGEEIALLYIPDMVCEVCESVITSCIKAFSEVKGYQISLENKLAAVRLQMPHRVFRMVDCIKEEGYHVQIKSIR